MFHWYYSSWTQYRCCLRQQWWNKFLVFGKTAFHGFDFTSWLSSYNTDVHRTALFHYNLFLIVFVYLHVLFSFVRAEKNLELSPFYKLLTLKLFQKRNVIHLFILLCFWPCGFPTIWISHQVDWNSGPTLFHFPGVRPVLFCFPGNTRETLIHLNSLLLPSKEERNILEMPHGTMWKILIYRPTQGKPDPKLSCFCSWHLWG